MIGKLMTIGPKLKLIKNSEIYDFIPPEEVPKYFGGDNPVDFTIPPAGIVSWSERQFQDINDHMIKKFMKVYEPVIKDTRQTIQSYDLM